MKRTLSMVSRLAMAGIVAGVLSFGAREALASQQSNRLFSCHRCTSQEACQTCCADMGFQSGTCTAAGACLCS